MMCKPLLLVLFNLVENLQSAQIAFFAASALDFLLHAECVLALSLHHLIEAPLLDLHLLADLVVLEHLSIANCMTLSLQDVLHT